MRNVKVNKIYNHQKSGESANSEVQQEKNSKRCKKNLKYQSKTVDRLLPISVFFSCQLPLRPKVICIVAEFYFRQPKQKIVKDGRAWPKPRGWRGDGKKEVKYFNAEKTIFLL